MKRSYHDNSGFTIIELISVLLIIGILSAVAVSRLTSTDIYGLIAETDTLKTHLRYAQFRAISDDIKWKVELTSGSYTLYKADGANWVNSNLPDATPQTVADSAATHTFANDATVTSGNQTIIYDQWGSPGTADIAITLSNGSDTRTVNITKNTGFIP